MKKRQRKLSTTLILFIVLLCSYQCDKLAMDKKYPLYFMNNSDRRVTINLNSDGTYVGREYPDTAIAETLLQFERPLNDDWGVKPRQKVMFSDGSMSWEKIYNSVSSDTLSFMIFDIDTLNTYSNEIIRSEYKVLQRYDLSIYDLQKLDYTLYYPPTEAMRHMKMWPRYKD